MTKEDNCTSTPSNSKHVKLTNDVSVLDATIANVLSFEKLKGDTINLYFDFLRQRSLSKQESISLASSFTPLLINRKICRHTKTMLEKTHCRTTSILLYLCTFQLRNTGCLPLSASSTFVYTSMILPAFQRTHTNQYSKPWNESLSRKNNKPCHHNNVRCYTGITGKRKHHHVHSRWTRSTVVCIPARNLSAFLREFMRIRVKWYNIMPTTVMLVTCALKRRNGTCTKRNIFNSAFNDIWDAIFTFIYKLEYILYFGKKKTTFRRFVGSCHALLLQSLLLQNVVNHMFHSHFPSFTWFSDSL